GDRLLGAGPFTVTGYLVRATELAVELIRSANDPRDPRDLPRRRRRREPEGGPLAEAIDRVLKYGELATTAAMLEAAELLYRGLRSLLPLRGARMSPQDHPLLDLSISLTGAVKQRMESILEADHELRRVWEVVDVLLAMTRGLLREGVALRP